ncbi:MAG: hypothetical protein U9N01_04325 [Euryarchaeota archaeon]|nr:hypothetical protein [Euryarchaeota archaeon]
MIPLYLNKINSDKKAIECAAILDAGHPTHAERLWLVGFLKFIGYSMDEVINIIQEHCQWADFNERLTSYQVGTIYGRHPQSTMNHGPSRARKWDLSPVEVLRIRRQRSIALSKQLCEEHKQIPYPHPERLGNFNSWAEYVEK